MNYILILYRMNITLGSLHLVIYSFSKCNDRLAKSCNDV